MRDPRSTRRYRTARDAYVAAMLGTPCALCGHAVTTSPTVEHRLAIRYIQATARTWDECVAMACDTSTWGLAHASCNSRQGARVVNATRASTPSRW